MAISCCTCEPMETVRSFWRRHTCGSDTTKVGTRARGCTVFVVLCIGGFRARDRQGEQHVYVSFMLAIFNMITGTYFVLEINEHLLTEFCCRS